MKAYWGVEVQFQAFLTLALDGDEWSASCPGRFNQGIHCIRRWVNQGAGLDAVVNKEIPVTARNRTQDVSIYALNDCYIAAHFHQRPTMTGTLITLHL
jgi:hypothetical protein